MPADPVIRMMGRSDASASSEPYRSGFCRLFRASALSSSVSANWSASRSTVSRERLLLSFGSHMNVWKSGTAIHSARLEGTTSSAVARSASTEACSPTGATTGTVRRHQIPSLSLGGEAREPTSSCLVPGSSETVTARPRTQLKARRSKPLPGLRKANPGQSSR